MMAVVTAGLLAAVRALAFLGMDFRALAFLGVAVRALDLDSRG